MAHQRPTFPATRKYAVWRTRNALFGTRGRCDCEFRSARQVKLASQLEGRGEEAAAVSPRDLSSLLYILTSASTAVTMQLAIHLLRACCDHYHACFDRREHSLRLWQEPRVLSLINAHASSSSCGKAAEPRKRSNPGQFLRNKAKLGNVL